MNKRKWHILPPASAELLSTLAESFPLEGGLPLLLAQLLYNRGIADPGDARLFLSPDEALSHDPFLMNDMDIAVRRIFRSLDNHELIAVYGDYDVDGITGTVLLEQVLAHLGGSTCHYIPHRTDEGYGLNNAALGALADRGVTLVIAVDCGANSVAEADYARSRGMDLIIADHHTVGSQLPRATAVLNPKRPDSTYPFRHLAGVGVAFKLAQALLRVEGGRLRVEGLSHSTLNPQPSTLCESDLLDLVALGTVADLVPLVGENRYLVKRGLGVINSTNRIGLRQMISLSSLKSGAVDAGTIGYILGPRLNAAGRLGSAAESYDLLSTNDGGEAKRLAEALEGKNAERQRLTEETYTAAYETLASQVEESTILMAAGRSFPTGVVGLVAGKLADRFYKPAVIIEEGDEECRGSARSIPEFNIVEALNSCRDCLVRFGGHAQAAGFTIKRSNLPRFKEQLMALANAALRDVELRPSLTIDVEVPLSRLNGQVMGSLQRFSPFGAGNPTPTFLSRKTRVLEGRQVGIRGDHLKLRLSDGRNIWSAIGFGLGSLASNLSTFVDIVYSPEASVWNGERFIQLRVSDLRASRE